MLASSSERETLRPSALDLLADALERIADAFDKQEQETHAHNLERIASLQGIKVELERSFDRYQEIKDAVSDLHKDLTLGFANIELMLSNKIADDEVFDLSVKRRLHALEKKAANGKAR